MCNSVLNAIKSVDIPATTTFPTNELPKDMKTVLLNRNSFILFLSAVLLSGCASTYYNAMEKVGIHKRDILVDRVEDARDAQQESKEEFKSALEKFSHVLNFDGGELEEKYEDLKDKYESSKEAAESVSDRISDIEDVANALFSEWSEELKQYSNANLRRSSERKLRDTKSQYQKLISSMKKAESKMQPVLAAFNDQVLFMKHNLNAKAISSLQPELTKIEGNVARLIKEMEASISEANSFIESMNAE